MFTIVHKVKQAGNGWTNEYPFKEVRVDTLKEAMTIAFITARRHASDVSTWPPKLNDSETGYWFFTNNGSHVEYSTLEMN